MVIEKTPRQLSNRAMFQIVLWGFYFAFWVDRRSIGFGIQFYNITHDWAGSIFPGVSDYYADNTPVGRLKRMYRDNTR